MFLIVMGASFLLRQPGELSELSQHDTQLHTATLFPDFTNEFLILQNIKLETSNKLRNDVSSWYAITVK